MVSQMFKGHRDPGSLVLGAAIGVLVVGSILATLMFISDTRTSGQSKTGQTSIESDQMSSAEPSVNSQQREDSIAKLFSHSHYESDLARSAALHQFLLGADEDTALDLLEMSKSVAPRGRRDSMQSAIIRRLAVINPSRTLSHLDDFSMPQQRSMVAAVFHEVSLMDINVAVALAGTLDGSLKRTAVQTILDVRDDLTNSSRREIGERLGYQTYMEQFTSDETALGLIDSPEAAWNARVKAGIGYPFEVESFLQIAEEWVKRDGMDALSHIARTLNTRDVEQSFVLHSVVSTIASSDPNGAFEYARKLNEYEQYSLLHPLATTWSKSDPEAALFALFSLSDSPTTDWLESRVINQWASSDPRGLLSKISSFPPIVQVDARAMALGSIARTAPDDALQLMSDMESRGINTATMTFNVAVAWSRHDPGSALDWILSEVDNDHPQYDGMLSTVLASLAHKDAERAFDVALELPESDQPSGLGAEVAVILELSRFDVESAATLLPRVRERFLGRAARIVGEQLVYRGQPHRALELTKLLPEHEHVGLYNTVTRVWARENSPELLSSLPEFTSDTLQSIAARNLIIQSSKLDPVLTDEQIQYAETFLTAEAAKTIQYPPNTR